MLPQRELPRRIYGGDEHEASQVSSAFAMLRASKCGLFFFHRLKTVRRPSGRTTPSLFVKFAARINDTIRK